MLTDDELLELLRGGERDRVEFTREWKDADKIGRAICAFANDLPGHGKPGVVFVGVDDSGKPVGLTITDLLLQRLGEFKASGRILPLPSLTVGKRTLDGAEVAVVTTEPHPHPPVRYKHDCWVRVGPRQSRATPVEETQLAEKGREGNQPFDQRLVRPPVILDGLDLGNFRDYLRRAVSAETLAENMRDEEHQLQSHQFAGPGGQLFNAGLLCFAHDCDRRIPGAYVQFIRYPGTEMSDRPKVQREIRGTIFRQLKTAEESIETHIATPAIIGKKTRVDFPDYPAAALRQLINNAVLHRSYEGELANTPVHFYWFDDHIEIRSPGGLYGGVSESDFGKPGVVGYRNPKLAEALKTMGFVERHGFGIYEARKAMEKNGNPPPEFQLDGNRVTVILRKVEWVAKAAELVCCQGLLRFVHGCETAVRTERTHTRGGLEIGRLLIIPETSSLGDTPGFDRYDWTARLLSPNAAQEWRDIALAGAGEYTARKLDPNGRRTPLIKMARIRYILRERYGASEEDIQKNLAAAFVCHSPDERKKQKDDEREFERLMREKPSTEELTAEIDREGEDERIKALAPWPMLVSIMARPANTGK